MSTEPREQPDVSPCRAVSNPVSNFKLVTFPSQKMNAEKRAEQMAEEAYERMVNPEIFGGDRVRPSGGPGGGFRGRLQRGQHYEQVRIQSGHL